MGKGQTFKTFSNDFLLATEMVYAFERSVILYNQITERRVTKSNLFLPFDSGLLVQLASATDDPELMGAIFHLKSIYFQMKRQLDMNTNQGRNSETLTEAHSTALAFFTDINNGGSDSEHDRSIIKCYDIMFDRLKKIGCQAEAVTHLRDILETAKTAKRTKEISLANRSAPADMAVRTPDEGP